MRRFRSRRGFTRKPKDLVWTTTIFTQLVAEDTVSNSFCTSGLWEANANNFERATLKRIVGHIGITQSAPATSGTSVIMAITKSPLTFSAGDFNAGVSGDYDTNDVLWSWVGMLGESSTAQNLTADNTIPIDTKVQRRLDSSEQLIFHCTMNTDGAASPTVNITALLRCLLNRA